MDTKEKRRRPRPVAVKSSAKAKPVRRERKLRDQDVIYTPPKPFRRGRFLLRLATVAAIVVAILIGMSIFFKVDKVTVSGCVKYTAWDVSEASGIEKGSNLLTLSRAQVGGNIISRLPYVKSVRVGINLPDTVNIEITELDAVYAVEDSDGNWWLMNDAGKIVDQTNSITSKEYTRVLGVKLQPAQIGAQAVALEPETETIAVEQPQEGETVPTVTVALTAGVSQAERLRTALVVLQALSQNSVSGYIASVDLTSLTNIELWYEERFQIDLGDTGQLEYKIQVLKSTIAQMEAYESGRLDLSFKNWVDKVGYTPFA